MENIGISIIVNLVALVVPIINVLKEKHYVRRDTAVFNGIGLIATGIALAIYHPTTYLFKLPLAVFPLLQGTFGIGLTSKRHEFGTVILSSLATLVMLVVVLFVQLGFIFI